MKLLWSALLILPAFAGCAASTPSDSAAPPNQSLPQTASDPTLTQARQGFKTVLLPQKSDKEPADVPPSAIFSEVKYPTSVGALTAYLTPDPKDGKKHPAIVWITGGDCNSIGDVWHPASADNDQTAAAYRQAGIVMMFPSLRGGNDNPGTKEGFFGEVDDVIAAAQYLEKQSYVDPQRIYLGGHSTGGTLAMLVAESTPRFRGTFAFGPVENVAGYGADSGFLPFDISHTQEVKLRSPQYWMSSVQSPVWVLEGVKRSSNIESLRIMAHESTNPNLHFIEINGVDHFGTLAPTNALIARKIVADTGTTSNLSLTADEVNQQFAR